LKAAVKQAASKLPEFVRFNLAINRLEN